MSRLFQNPEGRILYFNPIDLNPFLSLQDLKNIQSKMLTIQVKYELNEIRRLMLPVKDGNIKIVALAYLAGQGVVWDKVRTAPFTALDPTKVIKHNHELLHKVIVDGNIMEFVGDHYTFRDKAGINDLNRYPVIVDSNHYTMREVTI